MLIKMHNKIIKISLQIKIKIKIKLINFYKVNYLDFKIKIKTIFIIIIKKTMKIFNLLIINKIKLKI